ncbi:MAG TPA: tRNA (pseudouridine(54)-N(1))-methyltransferase TrmY [Candidatus Acidoferrales bacterium]|nr:tRNA (pseudouridine(54)-N(1))-methyltransferase TrmY [Candidatus Acidoferrales bacterium]
MREFIVIGHKAVTSGEFPLNDMPGSAGRIDILARCVNSAFFTSFDIRRDTRIILVLLGEPNPPKVLRFEGSELKYLNPDERSAGSLIKKALSIDVRGHEQISTRGVYVRRANLKDVLSDVDISNIIYLHETGEDIRAVNLNHERMIFILGDHLGLTKEEEALIHKTKRVSLGPIALHTDHCIILVHNELDRKCLKS